MLTNRISIANDYSETPIGRYKADGPFSGERFREEYLIPALEKFDEVVVDVDGIEGSGSSFLDEAFGGLIKFHAFDELTLKRRLRIQAIGAKAKLRASLIWEYIHEATKPQLSN